MLQGKHWALLNCPERRSLMCQAHLDPASTGDKKVFGKFHFHRGRKIGVVHLLSFLTSILPMPALHCIAACQQQWGRMSVHQLPSLEFAFTPNSGHSYSDNPLLGSKHSLEVDPHSAVTQPPAITTCFSSKFTSVKPQTLDI